MRKLENDILVQISDGNEGYAFRIASTTTEDTNSPVVQDLQRFFDRVLAVSFKARLSVIPTTLCITRGA